MRVNLKIGYFYHILLENLRTEQLYGVVRLMARREQEEIYISDEDIKNVVIDDEITEWLATRWNMPNLAQIKGKKVRDILDSSSFAPPFKKSVIAKARVSEIARRLERNT